MAKFVLTHHNTSKHSRFTPDSVLGVYDTEDEARMAAYIEANADNEKGDEEFVPKWEGRFVARPASNCAESEVEGGHYIISQVGI